MTSSKQLSNENSSFKFNIEYLAIETKTQENPDSFLGKLLILH